MDTPAAPRDDLVRAVWPGAEYRADHDDDQYDGLGTLSGHFSVFGSWYEVDSAWEGRFLERIAPGAFTDTIANDRAQMRVLFNHGQDGTTGDKPLGAITELEEDTVGARYEVELLDTAYNRELKPGLEAGLYGASMRFSVQDEEWDDVPRKTKANPDKLPERTITKAKVFEFGPVTFPASPSATAGVRSLTDRFRASPVEPAPEPAPPAPAKEVQVDTKKSDMVPDNPVDPIDEYRTKAEMDEAIAARNERMAELDTEFQGRELPPDAQAEFDIALAEVKRMNDRINATEKRRQQVEDALRMGGGLEQVEPPVSRNVPNVNRTYTDAEIHDAAGTRASSRSDDEYRSLMRDHAMRVVERASYLHPAVPEAAAQTHVSRMLDTIDTRDKQLARRIMTTDAPAYRRAFNKSVVGTPLNSEETRAVMAVGVDTTGGFAVPFAFDPTIIPVGAHTMTNPFRAACRTEQIVGTDTWQGVSATAVTAVRATEALASVDSSPTFAQPEFIVKRVQAAVVYSIEMGEDRPDIGTEMAKLIAEAKDTEEEASFAIDDGVAENALGMMPPNGTVGMFTQKETDVSNVLDADDLYKLEADLPIRHRARAAWFMNRFVVRSIQALETSGGALFGGVNYAATPYPNIPNPTGNTGLTLLRYPIWEVPSAPADVTTSSISYCAFGDPQNYIIVDRVGMSIELIPHFLDATTGFPTGQRILYAHWRNDAGPLHQDGMRIGEIKAT
jgi:HK97 family phage major capsid protein/HK97 family phage prohead protease